MALKATDNVPASYSLAVGDATAVDPLQEVASFDSVNIAFSLDAGAECSFTVLGNSATAQTISELTSDVWLYRDSLLVARFRIVGIGQTWGPDGSDEVQVTAVSYKRLLHSRHVGYRTTFDQVGQADIIASLIADTQSRPGGDWGVINGTLDNDGRIRDRTIEAGENLGSMLENFSAIIGGPVWDIDGDLRLQVRSGRVETFPVQHVPLMLGANVRALSRAAGTGEYANSVFVDGDNGLTSPVWADAAGITSDPRGRWERAAGFPNVSLQATLQEKAEGLVNEYQSPLSQWSCDVEPSRYLTDCSFEPGDLVSVVVPETAAAPVGVPGFFVYGQVMAVNVTFTADGDFTVGMEVIEVDASLMPAGVVESGVDVGANI